MKQSKMQRRLEMVQRRIQSNLDGLGKELDEVEKLRSGNMDDLGLCIWETQLEFRRNGLEDAQRWIGWVLDPESLERNELGGT